MHLQMVTVSNSNCKRYVRPLFTLSLHGATNPITGLEPATREKKSKIESIYVGNIPLTYTV